VSKQTTNVGVLSELGRLPILYTSIVKFIAHIRSGENKIAQLAIESEFKNYLAGAPSYFDFIGIVLKYIGIGK
jgi:hypothetical protein